MRICYIYEIYTKLQCFLVENSNKFGNKTGRIWIYMSVSLECTVR